VNRNESKRVASRRLNNKKWHSEETIKKISESNKNVRSNRNDLREIAKYNMLNYCAPKNQSESAKIKRVNTRRNNNLVWHSEETKEKMRIAASKRKLSEETKRKISLAHKGKPSKRKGIPHSEETRKLLSLKTKQQWLDGKCNNTSSSAGHLEIFDLLKNKLNLECQSEYVVKGKSFDIFVKDYNLLIEFNGTYWHRDYRFYQIDEISQKIHDKDELKKNIAINNKFNFKTIWQHDWSLLNNETEKIHFLREIINDIDCQ
jgi:hypothetical protein